jgi:hypothetical protein
MLVTCLRAIRLRPQPAKILRTACLAAVMTVAMILAKPLGLVPAALIGALVYTGGLLLLRIVNRDELRALVGRGGGSDLVGMEGNLP